MFKIKNNKTGEYRKSGDGWNKVGKVWAQKGHIKNHLNMYADWNGVMEYGGRRDEERYKQALKEIADWEVIEYKIENDSLIAVNKYSILEFYPTMFDYKN